MDDGFWPEIVCADREALMELRDQVRILRENRERIHRQISEIKEQVDRKPRADGRIRNP